MKKKMLTLVLAGVCTAMTLTIAEAQVKLPPASSTQSVTQSLGIKSATLTYNRPNVNGRKVFGGLVPLDEPWRTGANNIPVLTLDGDVYVEGQHLPAGKYGLVTIPGKKEWTVIFSKNTQQWGTYQYKQEEDFLRFTVKPGRTGKKVETFEISFSDVTPKSARLNLMWDKTHVSFGITYDQDAEIMAAINEAMKGDKKPYFQAAQYYFNNDKDITKAVEWVNEAEKGNPTAAHIKYWKARILLKSGDRAGAIATAQEGQNMAREAGNMEYVKLLGQVLSQAK